MEEEKQVCRICKTEKPLSDYYTRSGMPHLHYKMCKSCFRELSKSQTHSPADRRRAIVKSEKEIIATLEAQGIPALPGKALAHQYADVIAWGCVLIEVKYSKVHTNECFIFAFTPQQRKHGIRGDLVVLVCDYGDKNTHHVFLASDPVFYFRSGKLKGSTCFMPNAKHRNNRFDRITLLPEYMKEHQDNWELIESIRLDVKEHLLTQSAVLAKQLRYLDKPDPRMAAHRYSRKSRATNQKLGISPSQPI